MASRFWVGGTGVWDASDTSHWSAFSGGGGGSSVPGSGDTVTFDGLSGGGTVTPNATINVTSITMGSFTGTLDFTVNNNNVTLQSFSGSGTGARTFKMGNGTWNITGSGAVLWTITTITNLTFQANGSTLNINYTVGAAGFTLFSGGAGLSYNIVNLAASSRGGIQTAGAFTIATLGLTAPVAFYPAAATTLTVSNAFNWTGTGANPIAIQSNNPGTSNATIAAAAGGSLDYAAIRQITFTGAGAKTANNSLDLGLNSGVTINPPGGGAGVRGSRIRLGM